MQTVTGGSVGETYLVDVPGLSGDEFAVLTGAASRVLERFGPLSDVGAHRVIAETRVLQGRIRVVTSTSPGYGKCPTGIHWAGPGAD